jgi:rhamnosyl/mannosyltransferase
MRILHVAKFYPPAFGGMETVVASMAEGVAALGHEVVVLAHAADGDTRPLHPAPGVTVLRAPYRFALGTLAFSPAYARLYREWRGWADAVHVHTPFPIADLLIALWPPKAPIVVTWHSDIVRQKLLKYAVAPLAHALCRRAAAIHCSAEFIRRDSTFLPPYRDKIRVIPFGRAVESFTAAAADAAAKAETRAARGGRFALAVGRLVYYKGFDVLIRAAADLPDLRLAIIGDGPMQADLQRLIDTLGLGERVTLLGGVKAEVLAAHYAAADLFVLPSTHRSETFALVQVEAMAAGLPVINTSLPTGVPEVSLDGITGLTVPPGDQAALTTALERLWGDADVRARFGAAGRARALSVYSQSAAAERFIELYESLR